MTKEQLLIIGAGMSASLGIPTTESINHSITILLDLDNIGNPRTIDDRLNEMAKLFGGLTWDARADLKLTLRILLDGNGARKLKDAQIERDKAIDQYLKVYKSTVGKKNVNVPAFKHHLSSLPLTYDLLSLKSTAYALKKSLPNITDIVQVLTVISNALSSKIAIPTNEIYPDENEETRGIYYNDRRRLEGAINIYKLLVYKIFKHVIRRNKKSTRRHEGFFADIINSNCEIAVLDPLKEPNRRKNYLAPIGIITYNWDPILPFLVMKINQKANTTSFMSCKNSGIWKKIYADFGVSMPGIKLSDSSDGAVYSFSEDAAFLTNEFTQDSYVKYASHDKKSHILIKIMKLFVPHGLFNIRICPRCQNAFFIFPEDLSKFNLGSMSDIMISDPIPSLEDMRSANGFKYPNIKKKLQNGIPDELDCPICQHPVYFDNSFLEIQSILKSDKPWAVNKIHYDYGEFFSRAHHIISIGYSFPKDDLMESIFLQTMRIRKEDSISRVHPKLTFIGYSSDTTLRNASWKSFDGAAKLTAKVSDAAEKSKLDQTLNVIRQLFRKEDIRFRFNGFPDILDKVPLNELLKWECP